MINAKEKYNTLLNNERIKAVVKTILDAYPSKVTVFPCLIFLDAKEGSGVRNAVSNGVSNL